MDRPLVSIIIPAYNVERYLKEAIDSALAQTYPNIEIIVVNDGSKDDTAAVAAPYAQTGKIKYITQENKGLSAARNVGIKNSKGEFIALLDADDVFLPDKIERQVDDLLAHPDCDISYCDIWHFYDGEPEKLLNLHQAQYSGSGKDVLPHILQRNFIAPLTVVLRRSVMDRVGVFDETYSRSEDWEYWVRLSYGGVDFFHTTQILAKSRIRRGSWSQGADGWETRAAEKKATVRIFEHLSDIMTPGERAKYHMRSIILKHKLKLWYVEAGSYFPPLRWFYWRAQKRRLL